MPIYKNKNSITAVEEVVEIEYHDSERKLSKESIVVHFGSGDILICSAKCRNEHSDEICLQPSVSHPIGERANPKDFVPTFTPVRLVFDRVESIDAFIDELNDLKSKFPTPDDAPGDL